MSMATGRLLGILHQVFDGGGQPVTIRRDFDVRTIIAPFGAGLLLATLVDDLVQQPWQRQGHRDTAGHAGAQ